MSYYYNIEDDIEKYPEAWCFIVVGGRNTGKTYSCLKSCLLNKREFVFSKRTNEDVDLICAGSGRIGTKQNTFGMDLSPFKSINRDLHSNVKAFSVKKGLGGFWKCDIEDDAPIGSPIGTIISLNSVTKFKGFDMSSSEWLIVDEFIPQPWERVNRKEGEQVMDLYKTIARDREHRNLPALKLICLANAVQVSNPITNILEITDTLAYMDANNIDTVYIEERGIVVRMLMDNEEFQKKEKESIVYKAMKDTAWGKMAFENHFSYNDFSNVGRIRLKNYTPVVSIKYKEKYYYIYMKDGFYYMTSSRCNNVKQYNLNLENEQKLFYLDYCIDLKNSCIEGKMLFEKYTMYDLIINYKKFFAI